jgi:hypothetical protein
VLVVFSTTFEGMAKLPIECALDKSWPYDRAVPGSLAAAQREAIKYVEFTMMMEL